MWFQKQEEQKKLTLLYGGLKFSGTYPLLMYMSADFIPGNETMLIYANLGFGMGREIY